MRVVGDRRLLIGGTLGALILVAVALGYAHHVLVSPLQLPPEGAELLVEPGMSVSTVAHRLAQRQIITHPRLFALWARLRGDANRIRAGEYTLETGLSPQGLLDQLVEGRVRVYALTLVEGWTFEQLRALLRNQTALTQSTAEFSAPELMGAIGHPEQHPEGRFLPETYHYTRGTTDLTVLQQAYRSMERLLGEEWAQRDMSVPFTSADQALIMASIVEKETGQSSERAEIAGVFIRRLQKKMLLQTDPTVIYGLGDSFDGNLRRRDLVADTPYNTYKRRGLPPTPIAMPGAAAIHATLHPAGGDSLYFVAKGDGSHHFSSTLEEHNRAVIKYQLKGRTRPFTSFTPK